MRRITLMIVSTLAALVLLFSYRTSTGGGAPATSAAQAPGIVPDTGDASGTTGAPGTPAPSGGRPQTSQSPKARVVTVNGTVARTRWGPVQVQVTISDGKITDVRVLQQPTGSQRDDDINAYALPQLRAEVLQAQSAKIDTVSGATVTSDGYITSLQAALDAAHFG